MSLKWNKGKSTEFSIQKPEGEISHIPEERQFTIDFAGFSSSTKPDVTVNGEDITATVEVTDQGVKVSFPKMSAEA
jgi:hypothetical protein